MFNKSESLNNSQRYRFRNPIAEPIINPLPTNSGIQSGINDITNKDFQINWPLLKEDYFSSANSSKRLWFEQMDRNFFEELKKPWIVDMNRLSVDIPFFIWLLTFASRLGIQDNVYTLPSINVQSILYKT